MSSPQKNVARKQRQRENLAPVLPPARGLIEGEKNLESLCLQHFSNRSLMLMAGVNRTPCGLPFPLAIPCFSMS